MSERNQNGTSELSGTAAIEAARKSLLGKLPESRMSEEAFSQSLGTTLRPACDSGRLCYWVSDCWPIWRDPDLLAEMRHRFLLKIWDAIPTVDVVAPVSLGAYDLLEPLQDYIVRPVIRLTQLPRGVESVGLVDMTINKGQALTWALNHMSQLDIKKVSIWTPILNDSIPNSAERAVKQIVKSIIDTADDAGVICLYRITELVDGSPSRRDYKTLERESSEYLKEAVGAT